MELYRPLEPKYKYDKYFPKTSCHQNKLGFGDTDFGVKQMVQWAEKYSWQAEKIAKKLKADTLLKTLENVHQFIYNNFQYKPDDDVQHIQSIACAWQSREGGINCKGYSTIASSILQQLGIRHYIRRVSYDGTNYTHVFVVVPVNNQEIIIDGTLPEFNHTTQYITKKDLEVMPQTLKYIGLNAPATNMQSGAKAEFINGFIPILTQNGIENIDQVVDFINQSSGHITVTGFGILADDMFLPFKFQGVPESFINQMVNQLFNTGMNDPFGSNPFGGSQFGSNNLGWQPTFGQELDLTGGSDGGNASGGATGAVWNGIANVLNAGANLYGQIFGNNNQPTQTTGGTIHYPSGGGGGHVNTVPNQTYGGGNNNGNAGGAYHGGNNHGGNNNGDNNNNEDEKSWYEKPEIIIPVALASAYGISKLASKKKN